MFREMRRNRQILPQEIVDAVLRMGTSGVLALSGDDGYPYAVPISYVYDGKAIYFHCARAGHKLDAIRRCGKASFCVVDQDAVVPEEFTTYFRRVIAFGRMHEVTEDAEKHQAMEALCEKYAPNETKDSRDKAIEREWAPLCVLRFDIAHITGKEAIQLVRAKQEAKKKN